MILMLTDIFINKTKKMKKKIVKKIVMKIVKMMKKLLIFKIKKIKKIKKKNKIIITIMIKKNIWNIEQGRKEKWRKQLKESIVMIRFLRS